MRRLALILIAVAAMAMSPAPMGSGEKGSYSQDFEAIVSELESLTRSVLEADVSDIIGSVDEGLRAIYALHAEAGSLDSLEYVSRLRDALSTLGKSCAAVGSQENRFTDMYIKVFASMASTEQKANQLVKRMAAEEEELLGKISALEAALAAEADPMLLLKYQSELSTARLALETHRKKMGMADHLLSKIGELNAAVAELKVSMLKMVYAFRSSASTYTDVADMLSIHLITSDLDSLMLGNPYGSLADELLGGIDFIVSLVEELEKLASYT